MFAKSRTVIQALTMWVGMLSGAGALAAAAPVKVGFPLPLSGDAGLFCQPILDGARMYAEEVNAAGGVLGRKLILVSRDTHSDPAKAAQAARELIAQDKVSFLIGPFTSAEALTVSAVARGTRTLTIAPASKTDRLTARDQLHPYIFRTAANATTEGRAAAEIVASWRPQRVATIAPDYVYGRDAVTAFITHLKRRLPGVQIVDQQWPKMHQADYSANLTAQMAARPDAIFSVICCGNFRDFARQANARAYFTTVAGRFIGVGEAGSIEMLNALGDDYPVGIWGNAYDAVNWEGPFHHAAYLKRLRAFSKDSIHSSWNIQGYISMQFLVEAIRKAGSFDSLAVSKALKGLTINAPQGPITMRAIDQQAERAMLWGRARKGSTPGTTELHEIRSLSVARLMD